MGSDPKVRKELRGRFPSGSIYLNVYALGQTYIRPAGVGGGGGGGGALGPHNGDVCSGGAQIPFTQLSYGTEQTVVVSCSGDALSVIFYVTLKLSVVWMGEASFGGRASSGGASSGYPYGTEVGTGSPGGYSPQSGGTYGGPAPYGGGAGSF
jgi:hypothetical protein